MHGPPSERRPRIELHWREVASAFVCLPLEDTTGQHRAAPCPERARNRHVPPHNQ